MFSDNHVIPEAGFQGPQNFQKTSNTEKMLHEVEEMMMMCAVKKHLPEGMVAQIHDKAVHYYADKFGVK